LVPDVWAKVELYNQKKFFAGNGSRSLGKEVDLREKCRVLSEAGGGTCRREDVKFRCCGSYGRGSQEENSWGKPGKGKGPDSQSPLGKKDGKVRERGNKKETEPEATVEK